MEDDQRKNDYTTGMGAFGVTQKLILGKKIIVKYHYCKLRQFNSFERGKI
jgi:hypothetical protein